jgi:hypothetical protein
VRVREDRRLNEQEMLRDISATLAYDRPENQDSMLPIVRADMGWHPILKFRQCEPALDECSVEDDRRCSGNSQLASIIDISHDAERVFGFADAPYQRGRVRNAGLLRQLTPIPFFNETTVSEHRAAHTCITPDISGALSGHCGRERFRVDLRQREMAFN